MWFCEFFVNFNAKIVNFFCKNCRFYENLKKIHGIHAKITAKFTDFWQAQRIHANFISLPRKFTDFKKTSQEIHGF